MLLFLLLCISGLLHAIDDRRADARGARRLAIVGVLLLPWVGYSVDWLNSLHQGQTISLLGESKMDPSMLPPLWAMVIGTHLWFAGSLLARARADNLWREAGKDWVRSEEHTSELPSLMRISYAVFCLKKKKENTILTTHNQPARRKTPNKI